MREELQESGTLFAESVATKVSHQIHQIHRLHMLRGTGIFYFGLNLWQM